MSSSLVLAIQLLLDASCDKPSNEDKVCASYFPLIAFISMEFSAVSIFKGSGSVAELKAPPSFLSRPFPLTFIRDTHLNISIGFWNSNFFKRLFLMSWMERFLISEKRKISSAPGDKARSLNLLKLRSLYKRLVEWCAHVEDDNHS